MGSQSTSFSLPLLPRIQNSGLKLQNQFHSRWLLHSLALMIFALKCVQHEIGKMKENKEGLLPNAVIYLNQRSIFLYVGVGHLLSFFLVERMRML
jgi:hypothetical protein